MEHDLGTQPQECDVPHSGEEDHGVQHVEVEATQNDVAPSGKENNNYVL